VHQTEAKHESKSEKSPTQKQGWIQMIGIAQAEGELKALYEAMGPIPGLDPLFIAFR
jgi:hypothetical protein